MLKDLFPEKALEAEVDLYIMEMFVTVEVIRR